MVPSTVGSPWQMLPPVNQEQFPLIFLTNKVENIEIGKMQESVSTENAFVFGVTSLIIKPTEQNNKIKQSQSKPAHRDPFLNRLPPHFSSH